MKPSPSRFAAFAVTTVLILSGCAVGPDYQAPQPRTPASYTSDAAVTPPPGTPSQHTVARWWTIFGDSQLNQLIAEAGASNLDLRIAAARVREVRAEASVVRSSLLPQVNGSGGFGRGRLSENSLAGEQVDAAGQDLTQNNAIAGLDLNWEVDLFGGRRRALEAARADIGAAEAAEWGVRISLFAEVGLHYLELRGRQKQLDVARANLRSKESTLALTQDRQRAVLASDLDVARAESQAANTRSQMPLVEESIVRTIHRLGVLLGRTPTELMDRLSPAGPLPSPIPVIPVGLPSDLLRRRPDILLAERELAASTARVGVATADLFPKFYLTGAAGLQSVEASDFFTGGSRFWSIGPTIQWPVFSAGRIRNRIQARNAREEQAALHYEKTVLTSLEEVENAMVGYGKELQRQQALSDAESSSRRAVDLANQRYRSGLVDFLSVLEAERSRYQLQEQLVGVELSLQQRLVRLYRALGGGWSPTSPDLASR